ncbi:MAG TPA: flagellar biosynthetic protein FliO [Steroidobacteraceae bacterium]|nr:flagellar biosynthetic protein FliO [Steroidobacteraceae bacterium]
MDAPLFAAPAASAAPSSGGGLVEVTLALLAIVALIAGLAWALKRMRGFGTAGHDRIQVLSERALGPKERCVLVRVGATEILVGVAPGSVTTLHVFPEGAITHSVAEASPAPPATPPGAPSFKDLLMKSLGK